jgi:hypothetical protein
MRSIRYGLHFPLLIVGLLLLWLAQDIDLRIRIGGANPSYDVLVGALHATSIVVSLRNRKPNNLILALSFIALAAVWSGATPILALWSTALWHLQGGIDIVLIIVTASAIGSAGYWLLVRLFWLESLRLVDCLRTVALCVAATLLSFTVGMLDQRGDRDFKSLLLVAAWWFAFSVSLYWSEISRHANKPTPAMANVS